MKHRYRYQKFVLRLKLKYVRNVAHEKLVYTYYYETNYGEEYYQKNPTYNPLKVKALCATKFVDLIKTSNLFYY